MKRGIMMYDNVFEWVIWIGQTAYQVCPDDSLELRINNHYYQAFIDKDIGSYMDYSIDLEGVTFTLKWTEIYKVRIDTADYKPYVVPL